MKVGENPKMPYPPCGRRIKTYARGNNDAPSITKYGSPVQLDTQIVALCPHYARTALRAPPIPPCHWHMVIATILSSLFDLLHCSTPQMRAECCLELTAVSGYRMFFGPFG